MSRTYPTTAILLMLPLAGGLLNSTIFGSPSLTAYFGFVLPTLCWVLVLSVRGNSPGPLPAHLQVFFVLVLYIYLHGLVTHTINLSHYYWVVLGFWMLACHQVKQGLSKGFMWVMLLGIAGLACLESVVVVLQAAGLVSSLNSYFRCTGTWVNPNVTAVFLAMALFAILQMVRRMPGSFGVYLLVALVLVAISLLRCRSAYLVCAVFLAGDGWEEWKYVPAIPGRKRRVAGWMLSAVVFLVALGGLTLGKKEVSTIGRGRIWKHSVELVSRRPVWGYGYGLFERSYNLAAAEERWPGTEPISMPYNDFIGLGVEGGMVAVAGWGLFICLLVRHLLKRRISVLPAVGLLLAQLTNFVFENIPAFALFVLYTAMENFGAVTATGGAAGAAPAKRRGVLPVVLSLLSLCLLVAQLRVAQAFREAAVMEKEDEWSSTAYEGLYPLLDNSPYYLERLGDTRKAEGQFADARRDYAQAMHYSVTESLLGKMGYCYQREGRYDSSEYFFTLLQNVAPARFTPRMALLALYRQKGDTAAMLAKAAEIVHMPVKVAGEEVNKIRTYAGDLINQLQK